MAWAPEFELLANDPSASDELGRSVAIEGDVAVVGAPLDDSPTLANVGAAYVFLRTGSTWMQVQKLVASDAAADDQFGFSVAFSGNTIAVGAHLDDDFGLGAGAVYIFKLIGGTWNQTQKLIPSALGGDQRFGQAVALEGDTLLVGLPFASSGRGAVEVFREVSGTWTFSSPRIANPTGITNEQFGNSLDISGDRFVVGAPFAASASNMDAGAAYVFDRPSGGAFALTAPLLGSDTSLGDDHYGRSVAVDGGRIVVGAEFGDPGGGTTDFGAAYVFELDGGWSEVEVLSAEGDASAFDAFGFSVDLQGNTIVVGAIRDNGATISDVGAAYVFTGGGATWTRTQRLLADDPTPFEGGSGRHDEFGHAIAIDGVRIVSTAPGHNHGGINNSGAAYVFVDRNSAPAGTDKTVTTLEDTAYTFTASDFGFSDPTDSPPDALLAVKISSLPSAGNLKLNGNPVASGQFISKADIDSGGLVFSPVQDANGAGYASFTFQVQDDGGTDNGGMDLDPSSNTITIDVTSVNDRPSFTGGVNLATDENSGPQTVAGWATMISAGPADESGQVLTFVVTNNDNPALFAAGPSIDATTGDLTYTPAADIDGMANITIVLMDDGGIDNGGFDTSDPPYAFTITINSTVNNPPTAFGQSLNVTEDGSVMITLHGSDVETPENSLTFTIMSLPTDPKGVLTFGGLPVEVGDTFVGEAAFRTLTFEAGVGCDSLGAVEAFTFTVTDGGSLVSAPATVSVTFIAAVDDGMVTLDSGILRIGGTSGGDDIRVFSDGVTLTVFLNSVPTTYVADDVDEVRVWSRAGNDLVQLLFDLAIDSMIHGGAGGDLLTGGSGKDVIFGDADNDTITGGSGNDFLVGGAGADRIIGNNGHDILVAGEIGCYFTEAMLRDISAAWAADLGDDEFADDTPLDETVEDNEFDRLSGGTGNDWFIINPGDRVTDFDLRQKDHDEITTVPAPTP